MVVIAAPTRHPAKQSRQAERIPYLRLRTYDIRRRFYYPDARAGRTDRTGRRHPARARRTDAGGTGAARALIADAWEEAWDRLLAPHWDALHRLLAVDVAHRGRVTATEGLGAMMGRLNERVSWRPDEVRVRMRHWTETVLDVPRTTTETAENCGLAISTTSRHLALLRNAGLVMTTRRNPYAVHSRTALGDALLAPAPAPPGQI